jgi:hypothetical protein
VGKVRVLLIGVFSVTLGCVLFITGAVVSLHWHPRQRVVATPSADLKHHPTAGALLGAPAIASMKNENELPKRFQIVQGVNMRSTAHRPRPRVSPEGSLDFKARSPGHFDLPSARSPLNLRPGLLYILPRAQMLKTLP